MTTLTLEWPDSHLTPNRKNGRAWQATHSLKVDARESGYFQGLTIPPGRRGDLAQAESLSLSILFCPPDRRRRDLDNLYSALKSALDGLAQAIGTDDSRFHPVTLDFGPVQKEGAVLITLENR